jgi:hypothetical protein
MLTSPCDVSNWLGEVVELDARPGGAIAVRETDRTTRRGLVEVADAGRVLAFRWRRLEAAGATLEVGEATRVTFVLEPDPDGTRLVVTEESVPLVSIGWGR